MIERRPLPDDIQPLGRYVHPEQAAPERLDRLVSEAFGAFPTRASARKACERGEIAVGRLLSESSRWVQPGDEILWVEAPTSKPPLKLLQQRIAVPYEDAWIAVVDKPSGMPTSGYWARTLERTLPLNLSPSELPDALSTPRPVHRLDSPTGGLVIVAKTRSAHAALGQAFEARRVHKRYRAIAVGKLEGEGIVERPVEGREARSRYVSVLHTRALRTGFITTLDLFPETGRTHQLRLHLASLGHPILGDTSYGAPGRTLYGKGLFLFAASVAFEHPVTKEPLEVSLEEPPKFGSFREREERRYARWHAKEAAHSEE